MRYDYTCEDCGHEWEVSKTMSAPDPKRCPNCKNKSVRRRWTSPSVTYKDRPPWTYNDFTGYKTAKLNDGPRVKIDPSKHGDLGAWHSPGEVVSED